MDSPKMTVGDLRRALADLPDDAPVYINCQVLDAYGPLASVDLGLLYTLKPYTVTEARSLRYPHGREITYTDVTEFVPDWAKDDDAPDAVGEPIRAVNLEP
jgi:hypothetical protein